MENDKKVALFIDAENVGAEFADKVINTARGYGELIIKRIYGGSKTKPIAEWREKSGEYAILSEIRYVYTAKKNASDISLAVDVMNVLHERNVDVFCIASSDSDFTALAHELRERGKKVIGMGMKTVNPTYRSALSEPYIELDVESERAAETKSGETRQPIAVEKPSEEGVLKAIIHAIDTLIDEKGVALMATLGNRLRNSKEIEFGAFYDKNKDGILTDFLLSFDEISARYKKIGKKTDTSLVKKDAPSAPDIPQAAEDKGAKPQADNGAKPQADKARRKPDNRDNRDSRAPSFAGGNRRAPISAPAAKSVDGIIPAAQTDNNRKKQFKNNNRDKK